MTKRLLLIINILIIGISTASSTEINSGTHLVQNSNGLVGDGNTKWIQDSERTSGHLGNDPNNDCVTVFHFQSEGKVRESCASVVSKSMDQEHQVSYSSLDNMVVIDGVKYSVKFSPDGCFMRLSSNSLTNDENNNNKYIGKVFKREPIPSSGCKI